MKRFKNIWIFSDSIAGHEIQSVSLAELLSDNISIYHCTIRQPWLSFAPRRLPRFGRNIIWKSNQPNLSQSVDLIITCGRRMAAVGKYFKKLLQCQHIQILNPGDNAEKYNLLICPEHDNQKGRNILSIKGSLHPISTQSLSNFDCSKISPLSVGLFLGNPSSKFFEQLDSLKQQISQSFPDHHVYVCGSRRTPKTESSRIKKVFSNSRNVWSGDDDGENPYISMLACCEVLIVTADSINMVSEACATDKNVIVIAESEASPKHQRFIHSIKERLSTFEQLKSDVEPLETLIELKNQVLDFFSENP
ncbi:MAG TPA: ELM1/GtrOC1 family putative glycosyltransferase [Gammaproteobacteria bacterium]|nr:mitochondrial fission ELM1 family protein [Xanthomonadales bacterium]HOP22284.1 ELM1/GtrOC1 family putative glycosyltransferase [Gammaproteobacteria bacterium]HPI95964.1 ELM1/GtrOC1 family putative glycosyltransferase [Gammaproteobacteria bacterium]HPQ87419.1 ELM1/GtrOC1 family putative glycosyltransferase [Gammaproteobacteria bacterium]